MEWLSLLLAGLIMLILRPLLLRRLRVMLNYKRLMSQFPGPTPHPLLGSIPEYLVPREKMAELFDNRYKKYGGLIRVWNIPHLDADLFISKPEYLEIILTSTKHIKKNITYDRMNVWLGTGLLTSTGSKWHLHRKLITPAFHFRILEDYFQVFVEKAFTLVAKMSELPTHAPVDLMPLIGRYTLDIICEAAMGSQLNIQEDQKHDHYVDCLSELGELTMLREFRPWLYPDVVFYNSSHGKRYQECLRIVHGFTEKAIQERKLERQNQSHTDVMKDDTEALSEPKKRLALLDLLLETCTGPHPLTDREIRDEVATFMFGGHESTSMAIVWTLYCLGSHPSVQEEVVAELDSIFSDSNRNPNTQDLQHMKYLKRVLKEVLRLYPSVPFIGRQIEEDLPLGDGYTIPAGSNITLDIFHTHRDPRHFQTPETFNPDHFLPEQASQRHPFAYIPFSAGSRNCIGQKFALMEIKTVISTILRNFKMEVVNKDELLLMELTLKPVNGLVVKLTPRKSQSEHLSS